MKGFTVLRPMLTLLLALSLALQPVLSLACGLHEIEHAAVAQGAHAYGAANDAHPEERERDGLGGALHDVLHRGSCCTHAASMLTPTPRAPSFASRARVELPQVRTAIAETHPRPDLRPPIPHS